MQTKLALQKNVSQFSAETRRLCTETAGHVSDLADKHTDDLSLSMDKHITAAKVSTHIHINLFFLYIYSPNVMHISLP